MVLVAALLGCGSAGAVESTVSAATAANIAVPRARILQFSGTYYGDADGTSFDSIELRRDGTCAAVVEGVLREGRYEERPGDGPATVMLTLGAETLRIALATTWSARHQIAVVRSGVTETLSASTAGTEEVCETSGGAWRDDDADEATGLYCTCPTGKAYIPSAGGCTE